MVKYANHKCGNCTIYIYKLFTDEIEREIFERRRLFVTSFSPCIDINGKFFFIAVL